VVAAAASQRRARMTATGLHAHVTTDRDRRDLTARRVVAPTGEDEHAQCSKLTILPSEVRYAVACRMREWCPPGTSTTGNTLAASERWIQVDSTGSRCTVPIYERHVSSERGGDAREHTKDGRSGERDPVLLAECLFNTGMHGYRWPARGAVASARVQLCATQRADSGCAGGATYLGVRKPVSADQPT